MKVCFLTHINIVTFVQNKRLGNDDVDCDVIKLQKIIIFMHHVGAGLLLILFHNLCVMLFRSHAHLTILFEWWLFVIATHYRLVY